MALSIALETSTLANPVQTGIARYTRQLVLALGDIAAADPGSLELTLLYRASRWRRLHLLPRGPALKRQLWHRAAWPLHKPYAVVHAPAHRLPDWGPRFRTAVTIHDVYPALDINYSGPARERMMAIYRDLARRADHVLCVSEHSKRDFVEHFGYPSEQTTVTHLGVSPQFVPLPAQSVAEFRQRQGLDQPYLLFVGYQNPNKNLGRLLEAFAASRVKSDFQLVVVGHSPPGQDSALSAHVARLGISDRVRRFGHLSDRDIVLFVNAAAGFTMPSVYEGFGLPILEAMACGVPVLTSTASSCPEVAAGHAILVDPLDIDAIREGLERLPEVTSAQRDTARAYAATKTWHSMAMKTLDVYRRLAGLRACPLRRGDHHVLKIPAVFERTQQDRVPPRE